MRPKDKQLADEVHRILNSLPLTRAAKRSARRDLLRRMGGHRAALLTNELKQRAESLKAVLDTIHRSTDIWSDDKPDRYF